MGADLLEYSFYYSIGEGVVAISDEVLLADQEVMVIIQLPKLQGKQWCLKSTPEQAMCRFVIIIEQVVKYTASTMPPS